MARMDLYVQDNCKYCKQVEDFMDRIHIHADVYNISQDKEARKRFSQVAKGAGTPVLVTQKKKLRGSYEIMEYLAQQIG